LQGNKRETDAKKVYVNSLQDADDLFLTTDSILYHRLAVKKYNSIWQDNENAQKDGSLSVYCGENGIRYLNCETEHGRTEQYLEMLMVAENFIERINPGASLYNYKISLPEGIYVDTQNNIFFGDKKVGMIKSMN
jgi:hypothetical protein